MIILNNISFSYGRQEIVNRLNAVFNENKTYCIMGPSGIGKTTLMNLISGQQKPISGTVAGTENKRSSYIFQENRLIPWLSVYENIRYVTDDEDKIYSALHDTGLFESKHKFPDELSGGMMRRAAIARAGAFGGELFFIDEPLYGLDIKTSKEILILIKKTIKHKTAFIITHSPEEAFYLADTVIVIRNTPICHLIIKDISEFTDANELRKFAVSD